MTLLNIETPEEDKMIYDFFQVQHGKGGGDNIFKIDLVVFVFPVFITHSAKIRQQKTVTRRMPIGRRANTLTSAANGNGIPTGFQLLTTMEMKRRQ